MPERIPSLLRPLRGNGVETVDHGGTRSFLLRRLMRTASLCTLAAAVLAAGCGRTDTIEEEKSRTLDPDERYLVELYMKINDLEKNLQENPADSAKKWEELRASVDTARVRRALESLDEDPRDWLGIYGRINELDFDRRR